jgi:superoxide dismutase, Cu-Zn family
MNRSRIAACLIAVASVVVGFTVVGTGVGSADSALDLPSARATIRDANGAFLGVLALQQVRGTVIVSVRVDRLGAGFHGFHVHSVGICDPTTTDPTTGNPAPFLSAGGHFNPAGAVHGHHAGDLPPLLVVTTGSATASVETDSFTVASLFDADGSAIIVHALPDNLANIPGRYVSSTTGLPGPDAATLGTGDSGGRIGCGVISRR